MQPKKKPYPSRILKGPFRYCLFRPTVPKRMALDLIEECLDAGWIGEGPKVKQFEGLVSETVDNRYVTAVNSGTSALEMGLVFCRKGPEKPLAITTPMTCIATSMAILNAGLTPCFVDIDPFTGLLSPDALKSLSPELLERTAVLVNVHWGGNTSNTAAVGAFARANGIPVLEDAAHSLGSATASETEEPSVVGGRNSFADFSCFSFQAIKHVTTADGGAITFKQRKHWERSRPYRWFGIPRDEREDHILGHMSYDITEAGRKFQMNDIAASIGIASISVFPQNLARRRAVAEVYDRVLPEATREGKFPVRVATSPGSSYWLYSVLVKDRYTFSERMRSEGIEVSNVHRRHDAYTVMKPFAGGRLAMRGLEYFSKHAMCIPVGDWLSDEDASFIAGKVLEYGNRSG